MTNKKNIIQFVACDCVGKTSTLMTYYEGQDPYPRIPTVYDCTEQEFVCKKKKYFVEFWDYVDYGDREKLRIYQFKKSEMFVLLYHPFKPHTFKKLRTVFLDVIRSVCEDPYLVVVATFSHQWEDEEILNKMEKENKKPIMREQGIEFNKEIKGLGFFEVSTKKVNELQQVFQQILTVFFEEKQKRKKKNSSFFSKFF
ncbi:rho-related protein racg [Anaeramoeba flamelloides]|uniref:Rho-related protein racg n=1 Tax=Anaeramoeba flamelloides TaxID=1746091 RepID=A0AAV7Y9L2_9EUKA|nr:rho-related protein racg [Anaeramoeba flamelloides]